MKFFNATDGLRLAYVDEGEGLPVLCLSGLTRTHHDFDEMASELTGVRLIRMDYRGRGESDWDPNPLNYSVPVEARDALELLDHLGVEKAAIIGSSRGGAIAMMIAATVKHRLEGVLLNDVGPVLEREDLARIVNYVGIDPSYKTYEEAISHFPSMCEGFANIPTERWRTEVERLWQETGQGLKIRYDPALRMSVEATFNGPDIDLWPLFDAFCGLPLALLRGANSKLLTQTTVEEMHRRRPDMLFANVPDRAHTPFLDELESLNIINSFLGIIK